VLLGCWSAGVICKLVCIHLYLLSIYLIFDFIAGLLFVWFKDDYFVC
jgi:hypothetical protein